MVERATRQRRHRPMVMIDLAVPRDIEPEVGRLDDVYLYSVDDLGRLVQSGTDARRAAMVQAEAIIETRVRNFMQWMASRAIVPVLQDLQQGADAHPHGRTGTRPPPAGARRIAGSRAGTAGARPDSESTCTARWPRSTAAKAPIASNCWPWSRACFPAATRGVSGTLFPSSPCRAYRAGSGVHPRSPIPFSIV